MSKIQAVFIKANFQKTKCTSIKYAPGTQLASNVVTYFVFCHVSYRGSISSTCFETLLNLAGAL